MRDQCVSNIAKAAVYRFLIGEHSLALLSWLIYNAVGIKAHGFLGYLKHQSVPAGVTGPILALLIPLLTISITSA